MSKFVVSLWMEFEADDYERACETASEIEDQILERVSYVENVGQIDVEEIED